MLGTASCYPAAILYDLNFGLTWSLSIGALRRLQLLLAWLVNKARCVAGRRHTFSGPRVGRWVTRRICRTSLQTCLAACKDLGEILAALVGVAGFPVFVSMDGGLAAAAPESLEKACRLDKGVIRKKEFRVGWDGMGWVVWVGLKTWHLWLFDWSHLILFVDVCKLAFFFFGKGCGMMPVWGSVSAFVWEGVGLKRLCNTGLHDRRVCQLNRVTNRGWMDLSLVFLAEVSVIVSTQLEMKINWLLQVTHHYLATFRLPVWVCVTFRLPSSG